MSDSDLRGAARVACDVPLRIFLDGAWQDVRIVDVSRTGVRVRLPLAALGLEPGAGLATLAAHLERALPRRAAAQFHPERLGCLISRDLAIVRVALAEGNEPEVELGCSLDHRLGDIEAAALELTVPREGEHPDGEALREPYQPREHAGLHPSLLSDLAVVVRPADGDAGRAWTGAPERLDATGLTTRFRDRTRLGLATEEDGDARPLAVAFSDAYGPVADLEIRRGAEALYQGPGRLTRVEVEPRRPGDLIVGLAFGRELSPAERTGLRLA